MGQARDFTFFDESWDDLNSGTPVADHNDTLSFEAERLIPFCTMEDWAFEILYTRSDKRARFDQSTSAMENHLALMKSSKASQIFSEIDSPERILFTPDTLLDFCVEVHSGRKLVFSCNSVEISFEFCLRWQKP